MSKSIQESSGIITFTGFIIIKIHAASHPEGQVTNQTQNPPINRQKEKRRERQEKKEIFHHYNGYQPTTKHVKGIKIPTDGKRSYKNHCQNCPNAQLSLQHALSCPAIQAKLFKISPEDPEDVIFSDKAVERLPKLSSTASE
ncbi:hypothetical protein TNCV_2649051 [Trichonephila clavipes]|nr:hypothetical protein TNCV_2649051 [Trichonephila clavipes]